MTPPTRNTDSEIPNRHDSRPIRLGVVLISLAALVVAVLITVVVVHGNRPNRSSSAGPANTTTAPSRSDVPPGGPTTCRVVGV
ncbi:MAG TPA: hypothetical protein VF477_14535 [Mycobacterium sp.]